MGIQIIDELIDEIQDEFNDRAHTVEPVETAFNYMWQQLYRVFKMQRQLYYLISEITEVLRREGKWS